MKPQHNLSLISKTYHIVYYVCYYYILQLLSPVDSSKTICDVMYLIDYRWAGFYP